MKPLRSPSDGKIQHIDDNDHDYAIRIQPHSDHKLLHKRHRVEHEGQNHKQDPIAYAKAFSGQACLSKEAKSLKL
jgi:hypothetical protein